MEIQTNVDFALDVDALELMTSPNARLNFFMGNCGPLSCPLSCSVTCQSTD